MVDDAEFQIGRFLGPLAETGQVDHLFVKQYTRDGEIAIIFEHSRKECHGWIHGPGDGYVHRPREKSLLADVRRNVLCH